MMIEILQYLCTWLSIIIFISSVFFPGRTFAKRYIPDSCKRELVALVGVFVASLLAFLSFVNSSNIKAGFLVLGIITFGLILAAIYFVSMCPHRKKR